MQTFNSFPPPRWADDVRPPLAPMMPSPRTHEPEPPSATSATPIYDALYAEFRRLFRALPGDRTGEEDLRFTGFGQFHPAGHPAGSPVGYGTGYPAGYPSAYPVGGEYAPSGGMGRHRGYLSLPPGRG